MTLPEAGRSIAGIGGVNAAARPRTFVTDPWVWAFCLAALAYLHSGIFQLFPIPGWVDAGMYLGYALNLPNMMERFAFDEVTYHGSRLSYVLPRFLMHQALDPTAAQHVETGLLYVASLFSVFAIGWHAFGRSATFLTAAFLAFNPLFLSSLTFGGADVPPSAISCSRPHFCSHPAGSQEGAVH